VVELATGTVGPLILELGADEDGMRDEALDPPARVLEDVPSAGLGVLIDDWALVLVIPLWADVLIVSEAVLDRVEVDVSTGD
jgi:hypothetical protein